MTVKRIYTCWLSRDQQVRTVSLAVADPVELRAESGEGMKETKRSTSTYQWAVHSRSFGHHRPPRQVFFVCGDVNNLAQTEKARTFS